jgi:hypothetical protein
MSPERLVSLTSAILGRRVAQGMSPRAGEGSTGSAAAGQMNRVPAAPFRVERAAALRVAKTRFPRHVLSICRGRRPARAGLRPGKALRPSEADEPAYPVAKAPHEHRAAAEAPVVEPRARGGDCVDDLERTAKQDLPSVQPVFCHRVGLARTPSSAAILFRFAATLAGVKTDRGLRRRYASTGRRARALKP